MVSTEQRILSAKSIYPMVMPPLLVVMITYTLLERDGGDVVFPWATLAVLVMPLLGFIERAERVKRERSGDEGFEIVIFTIASLWAIPLMILTGGPASPLWISLLVPVLGAGSHLRTLRGFVVSRTWLALVLLSVWLVYWERTGIRDWLNYLLVNAALSLVGIVSWYMVGRERQQREALAVAQAELRDVNQHLEDRVARQVEEIESARQLRRYLSPQVAEAVMSGQKLEMTTTRKEATVFFSDIRGFTALSEQLEPEELIGIMNEYLTAMTEIVFRYDGTLDKYIGDAIMVFFNDPAEQPDHAVRCVRMAIAMQERLRELQTQWFQQGTEPLTMGIGINTGYVTVGNIGSATRMEYTVLGNNVNLASRLCSAAAGGQILVSQKTHGLVSDHVDARFLREESVKGKARPVKLYEVLSEKAAVVAHT